MMGNEADARDAAQDTLVKAVRSLELFDLERPFSTWVYGIARNTCIDEFRRQRRRAWEAPAEVVDPAPSALHEVTALQRTEQVQRALNELPPMYREVLVLFHFEHRKYVEIAEILGVPLGTVMNRIFRARQKMRAAIEAGGGEP